MKITKHTHACVVISDGADEVLIDPGTMTPNSAELIDAATTILFTHEHFDHVAVDLVLAAVESRDDLTVYGPSAVVEPWRASARDGSKVVAVAAGDTFTVGGIDVRVFGETHGLIHPEIPRCANVGYLVGGRVFHPGDSYEVPDVPVEVLLLPTSGPWTNAAHAIEYLRAVKPKRCIQIHEVLASEMGQMGFARRILPMVLPTVEVELVPAGETVEL